MSVMIPYGSMFLRETDEVPGTGQTVADLLSAGYTPDDISALLESGAAAGLIPVPGPSVQYGPQLAPPVSSTLPQVTQQALSTLLPGPSPRISTVPAQSSINSALSWFTGSSLITGIPNFVLLGAGFVLLPMLFGGGGRRRR